MRIIRTELDGVVVIQPDVYRDGRGFFLETYNQDKYRACGIDGPFVQDNHSFSVAGTLRGLHFQRRNPQGKLVRVIEGEIYDVAVDIRRGSPTFGRWIGRTLTAASFEQLYIPPDFAHGFCVLSEAAHVEYKCTRLYDPPNEVGIAWNDPTLGVSWPVDEPTLSARDSRNPPLESVIDLLPVWDAALK